LPPYFNSICDMAMINGHDVQLKDVNGDILENLFLTILHS